MVTSAPVTIDVERDRDVTLGRRYDEPIRARGAPPALPCAWCRNQRERDLPVWPLPSSPQPLRIVDAQLVGAWGIGFTWNDGHATGVYSWELLRPDTPA